MLKRPSDCTGTILSREKFKYTKLPPPHTDDGTVRIFMLPYTPFETTKTHQNVQLLQEFSEKVHEVARASLDEVVDGFLRTNGIVADHRMTFMERTSLRSECRRLTQFLRLVDFVVVDTLRDLVRKERRRCHEARLLST